MPAVKGQQVKKPSGTELELAEARAELEKIRGQLELAELRTKDQKSEFSGQGVPKNGNGMNRKFESTLNGDIRTVVDPSEDQLLSLKNGYFVEIT